MVLNILLRLELSKQSERRPAISEQLRMPEKEAGMSAEFLTRWPVATGGGYFQTGLLRIVCRLMELRCGVVTCRKTGHLVFFLLCISCC